MPDRPLRQRMVNPGPISYERMTTPDPVRYRMLRHWSLGPATGNLGTPPFKKARVRVLKAPSNALSDLAHHTLARLREALSRCPQASIYY